MMHVEAAAPALRCLEKGGGLACDRKAKNRATSRNYQRAAKETAHDTAKKKRREYI